MAGLVGEVVVGHADGQQRLWPEAWASRDALAQAGLTGAWAGGIQRLVLSPQRRPELHHPPVCAVDVLEQ